VYILILAASVEASNIFHRPNVALINLRGGAGPDDIPSFDIPSVDPTNIVSESVDMVESVSTTDFETNGAPDLESVSSPGAEKKTMNPKLANAIERTGPALIMLGAVYTLLKLTGEKGLKYGLIPLMQLKMYSETTGIIEAHYQGKVSGIKMEKWWWFLTVFTGTTIRSLSIDLGFSGPSVDLVSFGMVAIGLVVAVWSMACHTSAGPEMFRKYLGEVAAFHFALIFLVGQSSFWIKTVQSFGLEWILYPALLVVVNDTMAYVFGVLMGQRKLLPRLSPKKTVEGFIGAGLSTCAVSVPLLKLFMKKSVEGGKALSVMGEGNVNLIKHALAMALYTSLISPFGGFLASAVKRAHGAKDFGDLIPGHGGVVDRFDCQVVTAPFVFFYLKWFMK
jgi:CDP-diglyceride synthetase